MAVSKIRVNTDTLNRTREELQTRLDSIERGMEDISGDMSALNGMWTGDAHDAYAAAVTGDLEELSAVCKALQELISYEGEAVTEYNRCEADVTGKIAEIRI